MWGRGSLHVSAYALNSYLSWYSLLFDRIPRGAEYYFETSTDRIMAPGTMLNTFELRYPENAALNRTEVEAMIRSLSEEWSIEVRYCPVLDQCWISGINLVGQHEVEDCDDIPASAF